MTADMTCDITACTVPPQHLCDSVTLISACVIIIIIINNSLLLYPMSSRISSHSNLCFSDLAFYPIGHFYFLKIIVVI